MTISRSNFEPSEYGLDKDSYWRTLNIVDSQTIAFTCEILPSLWDLYQEYSGEIKLLDVGSRTGAGGGLIGFIHQKFSLSRLKIDVNSCDIDDRYLKYARDHYPLANLTVADIFKSIRERHYDVVLCSHTIEHVPEPAKFVERLKQLAKSYVILACPFEEKDLIPGHRNSIDAHFLQSVGATKIKVYKSIVWQQSMACVAVIPV